MDEQHELIQYFKYAHLPEHLQDTSFVYSCIAIKMDATLPKGSEKTVALRKLLESKDAAVRSVLSQNVEKETK